ncbi:hypothetical protein [Alishewanella phage vB_AspM_Slicko01]|nr:hypothetical protein [Alishewanella phage vB_AspM_Slicko01]
MIKQYAERDAYELDVAGEYYATHISAMTREALHSKSDIAAELAHRDMVIAQLKAQIQSIQETESVERVDLISANTELKAQVEQLKTMLKQQASVVIRNSYPLPDKDCPYSRAKDALDYCEKTPAECLTEHDTKAAKTAFYNGYSSGWKDCSYGNGFRQNELSEKYANQLCQADKAGA